MVMRELLDRIKLGIAKQLGPLAWILPGGILALLVGLGQLLKGQAAQASDSLLVGSVLLALVFLSRQQSWN